MCEINPMRCIDRDLQFENNKIALEVLAFEKIENYVDSSIRNINLTVFFSETVNKKFTFKNEAWLHLCTHIPV